MPYVDLRPAFFYDEDPVTNMISATVVLPSCLNPSLQATTGIGKWRTERAAAKDAAFQAYVALYEAGLLNDNLLPLSHSWTLQDGDQHESICATIDVGKQFSPWNELADAWSAPELHQTLISLQGQSSSVQDKLLMVLTTPSSVPHISPISLYWDESTTFRLHFETPRKTFLDSSETVNVMRRITHILSRSAHSDYVLDDRTDFVALFCPVKEESQLADWCHANQGRVPALESYEAKEPVLGFVRTPALQNSPHLFHGWQLSRTVDGSRVEVGCCPLPRRRHFRTRNTLSKNRLESAGSSKEQRFPIEDCTIDRLPFEYARFNLFIPAILQHLEVSIVANKLHTTILENVSIKDIHHFVTAITAPSAGWITNYQRYEFFGDTVLKFVVSYQLFCDHGNWPEGFLSERKNRIVSNQWLARAALSKSLDRYIMTDAFNSRKWSPPLISEVERDSDIKRQISTKVIADVVEALIGATYIDSGIDTARKCIHAFLPEIRAEPPRLPSSPSVKQDNNIAIILKAEALIGHSFRNKTLLVEALTHPSCDRDVETESYQRLEFLGDAVLDMLLISLLVTRHSATELSQGQMTLVKSALVNRHFLGFLCLEHRIEEEVFSIKEQPCGRFTKLADTYQIQLWSLMRHSSTEITKAQRACMERYIHLSPEIKHALSEGKTYPWFQLTRLNTDKFFSDMIESLIGAIFVDSGGSLDDCLRFVTRIGLEPYVKRVMVSAVDLSHPKTVLERFAGSQSVDYEVRQENDDDDMGKRYECTVKVDDVEIVAVEGCLSANEAVVVGASKALENLKARKEKTHDKFALRVKK